jgi:hypothetical protein
MAGPPVRARHSFERRSTRRPQPLRLAGSLVVVGLALALMAVVVTMGGPRRVMWAIERSIVQPTAPPEPAEHRDGRWEQDLDYLQVNLARLHANAFHTTPRAQFEAEFAAARARIATAADHDMLLEVMRLIALVGDGHTATWSHLEAFRSYGLEVAPLGGTWVVLGVSDTNAALLGGELLAIDGISTEAALARLAPFVSGDTVADRAGRVARLATLAEALHGAGITATSERARYTVLLPNGSVVTETLRALEERGGWLRAGESLLMNRDPGRDYWLTPLPREEAVYLRYYRCRDRDGFRPVAAEVLALLDADPSARLVVDLRGNVGGDSSVIRPLLDGLRQRGAGARTLALIDGGTYSSGTFNARDLRRLGATLVGEPTGDAPGGWGEVRSFELPNSGVRVQVSTYEHPGAREPVTPDVLIAGDVRAWRDGRDPVLEAALAR